MHPIKADALKPVVEQYKAAGSKFNMGMVFPVSTHNYELRYWLAAGGLHPGYYSPSDTSGQIGADVLISVTPPPQMPATLEAGTIYGYCGGRAVEPAGRVQGHRRAGDHRLPDLEPQRRRRSSASRKDFTEKNPNTTLAITKALLRAAMWLDEGNGKQPRRGGEILSRREYIGADYDVIVVRSPAVYEYEKGDTRPLPQFNIFFKDNASYPYYSAMPSGISRRCAAGGRSPRPSPTGGTLETAKEGLSARHLPAGREGAGGRGQGQRGRLPHDRPTASAPSRASFIDGIAFDGRAAERLPRQVRRSASRAATTVRS